MTFTSINVWNHLKYVSPIDQETFIEDHKLGLLEVDG